MTKTLGIIAVIVSIAIIASVLLSGCATREAEYWGRITKEIK